MSDYSTIKSEYVLCPLCGAREARSRWVARDRRLGREDTFRWVRCLSCDLTYLNPRPTAAALRSYYTSGMYGKSRASDTIKLGRRARMWLKALALRSTKAYPGDMSTVPRWIGRLFTRWFDHVPPWAPGGRLLDLGTGSGRYLHSMKELGWATVGLDLDLSLLADAHRLHDLEMAVGRAEALPFRQGAFDVAVMRHVLEHLSAPVDALRQIRRILKVGGLLRVETPNVDSLQARWFASNWFHLDAPRHLVLFNPNTLEATLEQAGFTVLRLRTLSSAIGVVGSVQFALGSPGWDSYGKRLRQSAVVQGLAWPIEVLGVAFRRGGCLGTWARRKG